MSTEKKFKVVPIKEEVTKLLTSDLVEVIRHDEIDLYMVVYFQEDFSNNTGEYYSLVSLTNASILSLNSSGNNIESCFENGTAIVDALNNEKHLQWRKVKKIEFTYSI
jgi:hypothetical protein